MDSVILATSGQVTCKDESSALSTAPFFSVKYLFRSKVGGLLVEEAAADGEEVLLVLWASAVVAAAAMSQPRGWCLVLLQREEETGEEEVEGVLDLTRGWKAVLGVEWWMRGEEEIR
jgi:hypothetical protein